MTEYKSAAAFRRSLEDRLRARAAETSTPLDRLRKEAAGQRLLAHIQHYAPPNSWALKGGLALIARMDDKARATKDIDATWRAETRNLHELLSEALAMEVMRERDIDLRKKRVVEQRSKQVS